MRAVDIISNKKHNKKHTKEELEFWINGIVNGSIPDYQISAWLMAVCFNGLDFEETAILTDLMAKSGKMLDLSELGNNVMDKHSTGGVGDKISLILIPLMASLGGKMAKLSGRALGHTGGTIDKLESIPNFNTGLPTDKFLSQVKEIGCAIASQTSDFTYADKKLYELRDVTATVDCIPLITSSIVSKKIASGANIIVLDVKYGDGAFIKTKEDAENLSHMMVNVGKQLNRSIIAVISSMEEPLGYNIGNSLEVIESIEVLKGNGEQNLVELTMEIGSILLTKAKIAQNKDDAIEMMVDAINSGKALNKFKELITYQGGNPNCIEDYSLFPTSKFVVPIKADKEGFINKIKTYEIAIGCKNIGGGREKKTDSIDLSAGIILKKKVGDYVNIGDTLFEIYSNDENKIQETKQIFDSIFVIEEMPPKPIPLIYKVIE